MKLYITALLMALLAAFALAQGQATQKAVVISYPKDTPQSVIDQAMEAIKKAGGIITHEYSIIKGFAAKATEQALETVQTLGQHNNVLIEQDQVVGINT
ncbi:hypothetical protein BDY17DRAFT_328271 [Neohortaea acidophila]|uniref:Inhibitor I9 domain-containing protein n=1 Tax=Neohortaea acidophila TaxID=245834 RepID=A0A6A6PGK0_9PEZI|nr:uncharacterized protein BDY17DRAFT_328271 [Neohortaea acidophila]KAF2478753.1 hypothetical protein BDY17DRAFT_328271 [Neohortaea acidophila]